MTLYHIVSYRIISMLFCLSQTSPIFFIPVPKDDFAIITLSRSMQLNTNPRKQNRKISPRLATPTANRAHEPTRPPPLLHRLLSLRRRRNRTLRALPPRTRTLRRLSPNPFQSLLLSTRLCAFALTRKAIHAPFTLLSRALAFRFTPPHPAHEPHLLALGVAVPVVPGRGRGLRCVAGAAEAGGRGCVREEGAEFGGGDAVGAGVGEGGDVGEAGGAG